MKRWIALAVSVTLLSTASSQPPDPEPVKPASAPATTPAVRPAVHRPDAAMNESTKRLYRSARSGAEWLLRVENPVNGRFHPGWLPALNMPVDQDNYLYQVGATHALARCARYFNDDRYLMKARQATLSLLAETQLDQSDSSCRHTALPTIVVNRLASAGLLLLTIHELPDPADELLRQADQLARFIARQLQSDGSFRGADARESGLALCGVMASQKAQPAPWKLEVVARVMPHCRKQWQAAPGPELAAALTAAFAEAFIQTKEKDYAEFVLAMSDWVCALQYGADTGNAKWVGGFRSSQHGKAVQSAPTVESAMLVETLARACLATRHVPDAARHAKYRAAVDLGAQFLTELQYTEANTMHFTAGYRPALIGGFHASLQDGNLRLDHQQHAVAALLDCLTRVQ